MIAFRGSFLVALAVAPSIAYGQGESTPRIAVETGIGVSSANGGEYRMRTLTAWHLGVDGRVARFGDVDLLVRASTDVVYHRGDFLDICAIGSRGQCVPEFPRLRGVAVGFGGRHTFGDVITITAGLGPGFYSSDTNGRNVGANGTMWAWLGGVDAAVSVTRWLSLVLGGHKMFNAHIGGEVLGYDTITVGVRAGFP